jgi:carboxyl-terminal processing protease
MTAAIARSVAGLALALAAANASAQTPPRVALLVGNAAYAEAPLRNPANDVRTVAAALKQIGFSVTTHENLKLAEMREALRGFVLGARAAEVRLVYFAGHGVQLRGRNYLLPVDVVLASESDILTKTADATELIEQLSAIDSGANMVIIDACRTYPALSSRTRALAGARNGLSQVVAPRGTLVAFSTRPGKVARDGAGPTSVYARQLARWLNDAPDLPVELFFKRVRTGVVEETRNAQVPWESSDIHGDLCFRPDAAGRCRPGG